MANVVAIYLRPSARTPVRSVDRVEAVVDTGLAGDHARGGRRQVTLIDVDAWRTACGEIGVDLPVAHRRANLVVRGIDLATTIGQTLVVGSCAIEVLGETRPCELLDDPAPGLCAALRPAKRGGVFGRIVRGGAIATGDDVTPQTAGPGRATRR